MGSAIAINGKSWREKLAGFPKLPDVKPIPERMQRRHGPGTIVTPSPREVDEAMKRVPEGRLVTVFGIGQQLADQHGTTIGCTVTLRGTRMWEFFVDNLVLDKSKRTMSQVFSNRRKG